jgi:carbon-monoxide dehydrogenase iron sulfur subunit
LEKIIIQPDLCDGCLDCQDACSQLYGTSRILVREVEGSFYPIICQQPLARKGLMKTNVLDVDYV